MPKFFKKSWPLPSSPVVVHDLRPKERKNRKRERKKRQETRSLDATCVYPSCSPNLPVPPGRAMVKKSIIFPQSNSLEGYLMCEEPKLT